PGQLVGRARRGAMGVQSGRVACGHPRRGGTARRRPRDGSAARSRPITRCEFPRAAPRTIVVIAIFILTLALATANGAHDVPKGVATLIGARVAGYRAAIVWGALTTLAGGLLSLVLAASLTKLFSKGIVTAKPSD